MPVSCLQSWLQGMVTKGRDVGKLRTSSFKRHCHRIRFLLQRFETPWCPFKTAVAAYFRFRQYCALLCILIHAWICRLWKSRGADTISSSKIVPLMSKLNYKILLVVACWRPGWALNYAGVKAIWTIFVCGEVKQWIFAVGGRKGLPSDDGWALCVAVSREQQARRTYLQTLTRRTGEHVWQVGRRARAANKTLGTIDAT